MTKENQGYDRHSEMWENDPQVCRDRDPNWHTKIERGGFDYSMRQGDKPNFYRDLEKRKRYIAFLKEHNSPLADG